MGGAIALAQQPAERRPNVAEDNKAATLEDTLDFLKSLTMSKSNGDDVWRGLFFLKSFERSGRCSISLYSGFRNGTYGDKTIDVVTMNLSRLDSLSVSVRTAIERDRLEFQVASSGTNDFTFVVGQQATYSDSARFNESSFADKTAISAPCMAGKASGNAIETRYGMCINSQVNDNNYALYFSDLESAKRSARGMMHAALLRGGYKAVSPF
jgi:hypothetical protein